MFYGIAAGATWAVETIILGIALSMAPFVSTEQAIFLAPFVSTFIHDAFSALWATLYNGVRGNLKNVYKAAFKTKSGKFVMLAAVIGGPIGMTGYVLAINYMGASIGAVASAVFPAIGAILAYFFLKEKMQWYRWIFLLATLLGVYGLSYSPELNITDFWLGIVGAMMCAFGWGIEAVILAKCMQDPDVKDEYALQIRQTTSALVYGIVLLPLLHGWGFTVSLFTSGTGWLLPVIAIAAFFRHAVLPVLLPRDRRDRRVEVHGAQRHLCRLGDLLHGGVPRRHECAHADNDHLRAHRHRLRHSDRGRRQGPLFQKVKSVTVNCQKVFAALP